MPSRQRTLSIDAITIDGAIQQRASGVSAIIVDDYADDLEAGATFPPVRVFQIGKTDTYLLTRGFHRYAAHAQHGSVKIKVDVFSGSRKDAILDACGANAEHGQRRTNADKRKAVTTALGLFPKRSDGWIAEKCAVSGQFVHGLRNQLPTVGSSPRRTPDAELDLFGADPEPDEDLREGRDGKKRKPPKKKPSPKTYPAWDRYEKIILNVIALLDGLVAEYDRSVSAMIESKDWDRRRTQMAANYAAECTKAFDKLTTEFEANVEAEVS